MALALTEATGTGVDDTAQVQARALATPRPWKAMLASLALTAGMLGIIQVMVPRPLLLVERFFPGQGWVELLLLAVYAAFVTPKLLDPASSPRWRGIIWLGFSIVFFSQLLLGLLGFSRFLMTGALHLPIPALILAGPLYRGEGFFMLGLFSATLLVIGPAWCSYFCYIGAWDLHASRRAKKTGQLPAWRQPLRLTILLLILGAALMLRAGGAPTAVVVGLAALFGILGIGLMLFFSPRQGLMVHCTSFCPVGTVANILGRVSPFRLRISADCSACGRCRRACRYDALRKSDLIRRTPGISCTLCGDCVGACTSGCIGYALPGTPPALARTVFVVIIVSFHAVSLGIARI